MALRATRGGRGTFPINRVLAAIVLGILVVATALTLKPFFSAILWSVVLAVTAAPLHDLMDQRMPNRPRLTGFLTSLILFLILLLPAAALTRAIILYTPGIIAWVDQVSGNDFSQAPQAIRNMAAAWRSTSRAKALSSPAFRAVTSAASSSATALIVQRG